MNKYAVAFSQREIEAMKKEQEIDEFIDMFQTAVRGLARRNYKIFDKENQEYCLTGELEYDKKTMKLLAEFDKEDM